MSPKYHPPVFWMKFVLILALEAILSAGCATIPALRTEGEGESRSVTIASVETVKKGSGSPGTQVVIRASRQFSYSLSNHEKPPRVLVEIPDGQFAKLPRHTTVNKGMVRSIDLYERGGRAQVEIALQELVEYDIQKGESQLVLSFKEATAGEGRPPQWAARPEVPVAQPAIFAPGVERRPTAGGALDKQSPMDGPPNPLEYVIGGLDVLDVNVYQEKDMSGSFRVSASGTIPFPLLGSVQMADLTPPQAEQKLEGMLREGYIKRPQVAVTVKEYRSKGVSILGSVNRPGAYHLWRGQTTLLELISMAGGISLEEGSKFLILLRPEENGDTKTITIELERLLKEGAPSLNMFVQPQDAIYVTRADAVIVYGEVKSPGTYRLESKEMTVFEALSRAGGFTLYAAPNRTRIIRVVDGKEKIVQVRVNDIIKGERTKDVTLQPGDVIVVPESYF